MVKTEVITSTSVQENSKSSGRSLSRFNKNTRNQYSYGDVGSSYNTPYVDGIELTSDIKLHKTDYEAEFIMDSDSPNENINFHFSIYKWPSKGVPFIMSSRKRSPSITKERLSSDRYVSIREGIDNVCHVMEDRKIEVLVDDSLSSSKRRMASTSQKRELDTYNDTIVRALSAECKPEDELGSDMLKNKSDASLKITINKVHEVPNLSPKNVVLVRDGNFVKHPPKMAKSNMKQLSSLFKEDKEGNKKAAETGEKESMVNETKKPIPNDVFSRYKATKSKMRDTSTKTKDDIQKSESSGKVRDFVKVFNKESSSKVNSNVVGQSRSARWKETTNIGVDNEVKTLPTKNHDALPHVELLHSYANLEKSWPESIEVVNGESFLSGEHEYTISSNERVSGTTSHISNNETHNDNIKDSATKINATSVDENLDKGKLQDIDVALAAKSEEETQIYERKVKQWSNGKEGNIRALLSTMQFVLWPNSGWKPIPLVDIIEANAVKKAYQRALLCLHPDKLQQKGAAPYQKLIAEKVFDMLQEAWEQFNSLGLL